MGLLLSEIHTWLLIAILVVGELLALAFFLYMKRSKTARQESANLNSAAAIASPDRKRVAEEIERLRAGGEVNPSRLRKMSAEERAMFEITLIDALTKWPREDQHHLRSTLIKHGYDEQCARRMMKESVADRVRASTLLRLLRPQSQAKPVEPEFRLKTGSLNLAASDAISAEADEDYERLKDEIESSGKEHAGVERGTCAE